MSGDAFGQRYGPWAIVAGASEGVGAEFADAIAARGVNVVLLARRLEPLEATAARVASRHGVATRVCSLDLSVPGSEERLFDATRDLEIGLVVYNAGADNRGQQFLDVDPEEWLALLRRNCAMPVLLAHHYGRAMADRGHGGILLVSALGGLVGAAYLAVYRGTKAFDLVFGESLWAELSPAGVDVLAYVLGATHSPHFDRTLEAAGITLELPDSADVANEGLARLGFGPSHVYGEQNRENAAAIPQVDRRAAVVKASQGVARIYGHTYTP